MKELIKIGKRLKEFMDVKGIGINEMGKLSKTSGAQIHHIVHGRNYGITKVINILKTFDELNVSWLIKGEGNMILTQDIPKKSASKEVVNVDSIIKKNQELTEQIEILKNELENINSKIDFQNLIIEAHKKTINVQECSIADLKQMVHLVKNNDSVREKKKLA